MGWSSEDNPLNPSSQEGGFGGYFNNLDESPDEPSIPCDQSLDDSLADDSLRLF